MAAIAPSYGGPSSEQMDDEQRLMARDIGAAIAAAVLETLANADCTWDDVQLERLAAEVKNP